MNKFQWLQKMHFSSRPEEVPAIRERFVFEEFFYAQILWARHKHFHGAEVQGIRFFGTQESAPCYWMNQAFAEGAEEALKGHGGLRAKVLSDGVLRVS